MSSRRLAVAGVAAAVLAGCSRSSPPSEDPGELVVFAAASLREVFEDLARELERQRPGVKVRLNLAGSQELRTQIEQGAPADVFASAAREPMAALERTGQARPSAIFARNELVVATPAAARTAMTSFAELPRAERIVVGAREVPVGAYTERLLAAAAQQLGAVFRQQVEARIVSRELNVRQVLAKVVLGEADAGIVYRTDARAAPVGALRVLPIPAELQVPAEYPVAVLNATVRPALAQAWVNLVLSPQGQQRLAAAGFLPVSPSGGQR